MALSWLKRICVKIKRWLDENEEVMRQWHDEDPDGYYAAMEEQRRLMGGGLF